MTRTETLQAIDVLPVSDAVKAHAKRLIEGLPEWAPMPNEMKPNIDNDSMIAFTWIAYRNVGPFGMFGAGTKSALVIPIGDDRGAPVLACCYGEAGGRRFDKEPITDRDVWEMLRQLTGMVAITGGG